MTVDPVLGEGRADGNGGRARRGWRLVLLATLGVWLWLTVPLALGTRTLVARDVFTIHLPLKWFGTEELRHGRIPAFNPTWNGGQPFRGNPNALAWYPGNLLYLLLPFWSAFNLHYMLHWLLAFLGLRALARRLGQSEPAALAAALAYAGSGYLLSALMYYNVIPVVAWWPVVLYGAARGDRRGLALAGLACGLALLAGEPMTAALGLVPLLLVLYRGRAIEALARGAAIGALGLVVALPQVVSAWRALPFTYRAVQGLGGVREELSRLPFFRLLELVVPLPYGHPFLSGPAGFMGYDVLPDLPLVMTLHVGVVALVLAALAVRTRRAWALLAAAGLVVPMVLTAIPSAVERLSGGLVRYPEKFLLWFALAAALLAGWGLERVLADRALGARALRATALALLVLAGLAVLARTAEAAWIVRHARPGTPPAAAPAQLGLWLFFLVFGAVLLLLAGWAARRGSATGLLLAQLAGVIPLLVLLPTDATAPYREAAPWERVLPAGAAVFNGSFVTALGDATVPYRLPDGRLASVRRLAALDLLPTPGVAHGLRYPLAPDYDGLISPPVAQILIDFPALSWEQRVGWMRRFGVDAAVLTTAPPSGLRVLDTVDRAGVATVLAAVESRRPAVWWPRALVGAETPESAYRRTLAPDLREDAAVVIGPPPAQDAAGSATAIEVGSDRIVLDTRGGGGVAVVVRAYQPQFQAHTEDGGSVPTLVVDAALLGVAVPAGEHRVVIEVSQRAETAAAVLALVAFLGLAVVAGVPR